MDMWVFDYMIPSFIVLVFFLVLYFLKPVVILQSNKCILSLLILEVIGFLVTIFSCYVDINSSDFSRNFIIFINGLYYFIFIARYSLVSFFFAKLFKVKISKDIPTIVAILINIIITILIIRSPWIDFIYNITENGKFERVEYFSIVYIANFIFLLLDAYYIIRFHKKLNYKEGIASIFVIVALAACSIFDFIFFYYLTTDMFFLLVIFILYVTFENPDIYYDQKTGLYNFKTFARYIREILFRKKDSYILTFVIKNYTEKKQIYGVKQMDRALTEVGKFFILNFLNKKCFYMQQGRFTIVDKSTDDFNKIIDKTLKRFETPWCFNNTELQLSLFVIDMDKDTKYYSLEDIYSGYAIAYDYVRKSTNDRVIINQTLYNEILRKTKVFKALNKALLEDDLQVYYQPLVDAQTRKIVGAEALVRIIDDELGLIPPSEFITLAEKNGCIEQLGEQVLRKTCIFLKESGLYNSGLQWMNVNLSPVQCQNIRLKSKIDNIIDSSSIGHTFIHLEITEDSMIDFQVLENQMKLLITDGYKFSLDDFGSGYSNITRVRKFPFSNIKLDMSIVKDHFDSPDNMLIRMIKTFTDKGMTVTAEGVETKEMADELQAMGCTFLQGYYFSKPIPAQEFIKFFNEFNK